MDWSQKILEASKVNDLAALKKALAGALASAGAKRGAGVFKTWAEWLGMGYVDILSTRARADALVAAAYHGHKDVVELLLKAGADAKALDSRALIIAVKYGHQEIVEMLLAAGANPKANNSQALVLAAYGGGKDVVEMLLKAGCDPSAELSQALNYASEVGHKDIVEALLNAGADAKAGGSWGLTQAAMNGHKEVVELLLKAGANPKEDGSLALIKAAMMGHGDIVEMLAWLHTKEQNMQALSIAATRGRAEAVEALLPMALLGESAEERNKGSAICAVAREKGFEELARRIEAYALAMLEREELRAMECQAGQGTKPRSVVGKRI